MVKITAHKHRWPRLLAVGLAVGLLTACGNGAGAESGTTPTPIGLDDSGKLSEMTTVTISVPSNVAIFLPPLMEDAFGEFEARNIDLVVETVSTADSLPLLESGQLDAVFGSPTVGFANAIAAGADFRATLPGAYAKPDTKSGWWVSTEALDGKTFAPADLKGKIVGASQGTATSASVALLKVLGEAGLTLKDVEFTTIGSADMVLALENGAVFAGVVNEPFNVPLEESGAATQIAATAYPGYSNTFVIYGKSLLTEKPEVGKAFAAAYLATIKNHLQGEVSGDPERGPIVAEALEMSWDDLKKQDVPEYQTELSFPSDYMGPYQDAWRQIGGMLNYPEDLTNAQTIDTRFMEWANQQAN